MDNKKEDDDFEIIDPESSYYGNDKKFSHQTLLMSSLSKCIEAGSTEMRAGFVNKKTDKHGNLVVSYVEDTRLRFIESVKTLKTLGSCYFDEEANKFINNKLRELELRKQQLLQEQSLFWNSLNGSQKLKAAQEGHQVVEGYLNKNLPFWKIFIDEEVQCYRDIFEEINKLSMRKNFFEEEMLIN